MQQLKSSVTIREIAKLADVSVSTVSLVVRGSPLVASKTREKVLAVIEDNGYVHNRSAAAMRSRRSGVIALAVSDLANPYFAGVASSVEQALQSIDRTVLLSDVREDSESQSRFIEKMRGYSIEGLILCPAHDTDTSRLVAQLETANFPCVLVSRDLPGSGLDYVGYDHEHGMQLAIRHLIAQGHRRIALLGGSSKTWVGRQRLEGYRQALSEAGLQHDSRLELEGELSRASGMKLISKALELPDPPTAAACVNDVVAFGAMLGLRRLGIEPGRDFSITGNDDLPEAELWSPALTTVSIDFIEIGQQAVRLLLKRVAQPDLRQQRVNLQVALKVRETTTAAGNRVSV